MRSSARSRYVAGPRGARWVGSCVLVCWLGAACSPASTPSGSEVGPTAAPTPTPAALPTPTAAAPSPGPSPAARRTTDPDPYSRDPVTLARELDTSDATLADTTAPPAEVARAAQFQQLAVRSMSHSPDRFRRSVISRLDATTARTTRHQLKAAQSLATISDPQHSLPDWRIVSAAPPDELLGFYREAQRRTGVDWSYLAAIQLVETRMGRIRGASSAGALGPMQFTRSTWQTYGHGGDINDDRDAILAAARLLRANGAPQNMDAALWHYNPAAGYVRAIDEYAATMRASTSTYYGYWNWQVIFSYDRGTFLLPVGYPRRHAVRLPRAGQ